MARISERKAEAANGRTNGPGDAVPDRPGMPDRATARDRPPEEAAEDTSFARGLRVLLTIADRGEIRADELSALLETPISTIYRYLRTLSGFGFVDRQGRAATGWDRG